MDLTSDKKASKEKSKAKAIETAKHISRAFGTHDGQAALSHLSTLFMWENVVPPGANNAADLRAYAAGQLSVLHYIHKQINFASNH